MDPRQEVAFRARSFVALWMVLAASVAAFGAWIWFEAAGARQKIETAEGDRLSGHARIIAEMLYRQIESTAQALQSTLEDLPEFRSADGYGPSLTRRLNSIVSIIPGIRTIGLLDAKGQAVASTRPEVVGRDFSGREDFVNFQREPDFGRYRLTVPFEARPGDWTMNLARAFPDEQGRFAGAIAANLETNFFKSILSSANYAPDMWSALAHSDGVQFVLFPERPGQFGQNLDRPGSLFNKHRKSGEVETLVTGMVVATGERRMIAIRSVGIVGLGVDKDIVVAVSRDARAVFATWRKDVMTNAAIWGVVAAFGIFGLALFQIRVRAGEKRETKIAEDLLSAEDRYRYLFANSPLPMFVFSVPGGKFLDVNEAAVRQYGYEREEFLALDMTEIRPQAEIPKFRKTMSEMPKGAWHGEFVHRKKDGTPFDVEVWNKPIQFGGEAARFTLALDITERKKAEQATETARLAAEEASRAKSTFFATMSHEIRTPLNALIGFSQLISNQIHGPVGDVRYLDYAKDLTGAATHLLDMLTEVIDLSKIDANRYDVKLVSLDLGEFIARAERFFVNMAETGKQSLDIVAETGVVVMADPKALRQILVNLVSNAVKYSRPGGRITVSTGSGMEGPFLCVADSGVGMRPEDIPRALKPFERLKDPKAGQQEGTGLGLAIVDRLVAAMAARLVISSEVGKGTEVSIYFPRVQPSAPAKLGLDGARNS